ncbi:MFS transporter [Glutamicibacter sp. BW80]|uniref:MFS transporter n=1 Tax=unclassified Glutamicibacter TaxID=2627139 RepID=UPI000BB6EFA8|nr:MFS transporter [Glutamicibacter sp. BW80]PCC27667.1 MFS transporter [Glutamicibacter sp. BW80]
MTGLQKASTATRPEVPQTAREKRKIILGVGVGNALEWYDWTAYSIFAAYFAGQFFHAGDPVTALLGTLAIFGAGFLMRPLGGLFFGWFADRYGRRQAMSISMLITAGGSLLIGVSPTYGSIGAAAAAFLLAGRMLQGLGHGGEVVSSFTYVTEMAPRKSRGLWSSSVFAFVTLGVIAATLLGAVLSTTLGTDAVREWAWRIPFILGGLLGIYALYLRRKLDETPMFKEKVRLAEAGLSQEPRGRMFADIWEHRRACMRIVGLAAGGTVMFYVWSIMAPAFAMGPLGMDPTQVLWVSTGANVFFIACLVFWGWLSDRIGRKFNWYFFAIGAMILIIPLTIVLNGGPEIWRLAVYMGVGMILISAPTAIMPAYFPEQFPTRVRAVGMGLPYSVAGALAGGTAPYLQAWLYAEGSPRIFDFYLIALCALVLIAAALSPETRNKDLAK